MLAHCRPQRVAAWLVENGAYPNACDNQGETPMHCVMKAGNADAALELQRRRGNINLPRKTGWKTPVDLAFGHEEVGDLRVSISMRHKLWRLRPTMVVTDSTLKQL